MVDSISDRLDALARQYNLNLKGCQTFQQKCAAYFLLKRNVSKRIVARTFDISDATAGRLARASEEKRVYRDVAKEYHRLGHEEFGRAYFTQDNESKLQRVLMGIQPKRYVINIEADSAAGYWLVNDPDAAFRVYWIDTEGWAVSDGRDTHPNRYRTSALARSAGYELFGAYGQRAIEIPEREAQRIWSELKKTSNEVDKNLDKQNQEE